MKTARDEFDKPTSEAIWLRAKGKCECCGAPFGGRRPIYDHRIPCALGGKGTVENGWAICPKCDAAKTNSEDKPRIAKAKRVEEKQAGLRKKQSRFATSRDSKFKKKLNGTVELR